MSAGTVTVIYREGSHDEESFNVADVHAVATAFRDHMDKGSPHYLELDWYGPSARPAVIRLSSVHTIVFKTH